MATAVKHPQASFPANGLTNGSVRVEIFDQGYNLRGSDAEYILKLAAYVDAKMRAVAEHTQTVDTSRVAVLAAINIADEYHLAKGNLEPLPDVKQRAKHLARALDEVLEDKRKAGDLLKLGVEAS